MGSSAMSTYTKPAGVPDFGSNYTMQAAADRLDAVKHAQFKQGRAFLEAITGGAMPNRFVLSDMMYQYQPMRDGKEYGKPEGWPMFIAEEKYGDCCSRDCWCRCCCNPMHPSITELYVSSGPIQAEACCCGCCNQPDFANPEGQPIMTYERLGCCARFANCWVCCECCQDEMRFHNGGDDFMHTRDGNARYAPSKAGECDVNDLLAIGKVPIGGGGCTPTIETFQIAPGDAGDKLNVEGKKPIYVVEGPTCFGGCYDFCCNTTFTIGTEAGKADLVEIVKQKPDDCDTCCRACCSTADIYNFHVKEGAMIDKQHKAMMIGSMVHLDYMFFERDRFPVTCEREGDTTWVTILCCLCYCYGCLCPCKLAIPLKDKQ